MLRRGRFREGGSLASLSPVEREVDAPTPDADARFARRVVAGTVGVVCIAVLWAHRVGAGGDTILGGLGPVIEGAIAIGRGVLLAGGGVLAGVRAPLLVAALV